MNNKGPCFPVKEGGSQGVNLSLFIFLVLLEETYSANCLP